MRDKEINDAFSRCHPVEFDPLRDEGEEYGRRLKEAGNYVEVHRIPNALHGFFALGIRFLHVQESFEIMNSFLRKEGE